MNAYCKQFTHTDGNTTEKLFHQMEKEISFQHDDFKSKNSVINLLLEILIRCKDNYHDEKNIHANHDVEIIQNKGGTDNRKGHSLSVTTHYLAQQQRVRNTMSKDVW